MTAPTNLVLDVGGYIRQLKELAAMNVHRCDFCALPEAVIDITQEVVQRIRDRRYAQKRLREFAAEIQAGACNAGGSILPPVFAPVVLSLGQEMVRQLEMVGAYLPDSVLPYHLHVLPRLSDNITVVLERTNELPP